MTPAAELPDWAALLTAILVLLGSAMTLVGTVGLMRFKNFYRRVHAPTLGTTFGTIFVSIGSMVFFSVSQYHLIVHGILIIVFVTITTPVSLMLLVRAGLVRDIREENPEISAPRISGIQ